MYLFTGRVYALHADKLRPAALSRVPSCADAKPKHFFCARDHTEPRFDGRQPGTISELRRNPEGYQELAIKDQGNHKTTAKLPRIMDLHTFLSRAFRQSFSQCERALRTGLETDRSRAAVASYADTVWSGAGKT